RGSWSGPRQIRGRSMERRLDGRVCIVTGAGRGLGRAEAIELARHGACVVINDAGYELDGTPGDPGVAGAVADEVAASGGIAIASTADVATMDGARAVFDLALETFGGLHAVVNNAGVLRDGMFAT